MQFVSRAVALGVAFSSFTTVAVALAASATETTAFTLRAFGSQGPCRLGTVAVIYPAHSVTVSKAAPVDAVTCRISGTLDIPLRDVDAKNFTVVFNGHTVEPSIVDAVTASTSATPTPHSQVTPRATGTPATTLVPGMPYGPGGPGLQVPNFFPTIPPTTPLPTIPPQLIAPRTYPSLPAGVPTFPPALISREQAERAALAITPGTVRASSALVWFPGRDHQDWIVSVLPEGRSPAVDIAIDATTGAKDVIPAGSAR